MATWTRRRLRTMSRSSSPRRDTPQTSGARGDSRIANTRNNHGRFGFQYFALLSFISAIGVTSVFHSAIFHCSFIPYGEIFLMEYQILFIYELFENMMITKNEPVSVTLTYTRFWKNIFKIFNIFKNHKRMKYLK